MYLANFCVDPFSLGGGFRGYLLLRNDGHAKLIHDNRLPQSVEEAHVEERRVVRLVRRPAPGHRARGNWPRWRPSTPPAAACASTTAPATPTPKR